MENNTVMFELSVHDPPEVRDEVLDGCRFAAATDMDILVLRHGDHFFGSRSQIHIWLTWHDYRNAPLMILLCYMLVGHPDWRAAEIHINAAVPEQEAAEEVARLEEMIATGRIPISRRNLTLFPTDPEAGFVKGTLPQAAGSMAGFMLGGGGTALGAGVMGAATQMGGAYEEMRRAGVDDDTATLVTVLTANGLLGATCLASAIIALAFSTRSGVR